MKPLLLLALLALLAGSALRLAHERVTCRVALAEYGLQAQLAAGNPCWALRVRSVDGAMP